MRKAVAPEHRTHFHKQGQITFDPLFSPEECQQVLALPALSPHSPVLHKFLQKYQLAEIAFELTGKEPLRIALVTRDATTPIETETCALWIALDTGHLTYSKHTLAMTADCILIVFTNRYLDPDRHPILYRRA